MYEQTEQFGAEHVRDTITNAELSGDIKVLTGEKDTYQAKNIIIATGAYARPIGCKGEQEYKGRGISYCATCDANFFTDLEVYVAGGGDAAVEEALYLTKFARKVTIIHRRDELRAAKSIQEKAFKNPKLFFMCFISNNFMVYDSILLTIIIQFFLNLIHYNRNKKIEHKIENSSDHKRHHSRLCTCNLFCNCKHLRNSNNKCQ